jgi:hypothetical protein
MSAAHRRPFAADRGSAPHAADGSYRDDTALKDTAGSYIKHARRPTCSSLAPTSPSPPGSGPRASVSTTVDTGLRRVVVTRTGQDRSKALECAVHLALRRQLGQVFYWRDFLVDLSSLEIGEDPSQPSMARSPVTRITASSSDAADHATPRAVRSRLFV